jgi:hypothetical protein
MILEVLRPYEAYALLERILGEDRAYTKRAATEQLERTCSCVPLALRIVAVGTGGVETSEYADWLLNDPVRSTLRWLPVKSFVHG